MRNPVAIIFLCFLFIRIFASSIVRSVVTKNCIIFTLLLWFRYEYYRCICKVLNTLDSAAMCFKPLIFRTQKGLSFPATSHPSINAPIEKQFSHHSSEKEVMYFCATNLALDHLALTNYRLWFFSILILYCWIPMTPPGRPLNPLLLPELFHLAIIPEAWWRCTKT